MQHSRSYERPQSAGIVGIPDIIAPSTLLLIRKIQVYIKNYYMIMKKTDAFTNMEP